MVQGFASGDLERDGAAIRLFADAGMEMLLAQVRCWSLCYDTSHASIPVQMTLVVQMTWLNIGELIKN